MNDPFKPSEWELDGRARRIDLAHESDFALGPVRVQPSLRKISGDKGEVMLEPKVMQVLVALATPNGAILSRDDLIERCWEGRVVGDTSINRVISLLRGGLKEVAGGAVTIENVPKVGYRTLISEAALAADAAAQAEEQARDATALEAAEHAAAAEAETEAETEAGALASSGLSGGQNRRGIMAAGLAAVLVVIAGLVWWQTGSQSAHENVSIAMLPIEVSDGVDPLYAAGLEAGLRAELARVGAMEVTSSESARALVEEGLSPAEIGERLKADYVWTGSVAVAAERVTLKATMIKPDDRSFQWSETFASAPDAGQNLPFRSARAVSVRLGRPVMGSEPGRSVSSGDYKLYLTALGLIKSRGIEERFAAHDILEQVTRRNPDFAAGWGAFAKSNYLYPSKDREAIKQRRAKAKELAEHALTLDPDSVEALKVTGMLSIDAETSLASLGRATQLDPGDSEALYWLNITQRQYPLFAKQGGLESSQRMVEIDPLWPPSWSASDMAAEYGRLDLARELERDILAAAVSPSQKLFAQARLRRLEGDYSGFMELYAKAASTMSETERRYAARRQTAIMRYLMDIPPIDGDSDLLRLKASMPGFREISDLPSRAEFEKAGLAGAGYWDDESIMMVTMPLFLSEGRSDELLFNYDAKFKSAEEFLAFMDSEMLGVHMAPLAVPYIASAMREAGRDREADALIKVAEGLVAQLKAAAPGWIYPVLYEMRLAALQGDNARLIKLVRSLPSFGWPYTMGHVNRDVVGLLRDDAIYEEARQLPEIRAVLDPIWANLAKEREEVLALDLD